MRHLILLRHGQSRINAAQQTQSIFCGQLDTPLTEIGRQQARDAGRILAESSEYRISHAVSSSLARAAETLELVLQQLHQPPFRFPARAGFNERSLGLFEGRPEQDVLEQFPEYRDNPQFSAFRADFHQKAPGGENLTEVSQRAHRELLQHLPYVTDDLLLVSHCQTIRCLIGVLTNASPQSVMQLPVPNATPIILARSGPDRWQITSDD
ncbi:MAG: histidine phosphatase family protein [Planctomyces sp.]